jgi:hypothetical protein
MTSPAEIEKYLEENLLLKSQMEERTGKTVEQLYNGRAKRVRDVIELSEPDRVPFMVLIEPHEYSGIPQSAAFWRGDPVFMSDAQFKKFYWPGLKKSLQTHVDPGYVPVPFFESKFGDRLECMLELPKGKILASIEAADAVRAKEILGGHTSLLVRCPNTCKLWSLGQLESFIKDLIDKCGKKGGAYNRHQNAG